MKFLILGLLFTATLWPEFSVAQVRQADLIGRWDLTSVTCYSDHTKYPGKGWTLTIDGLNFSSDINARCDLKYSLFYQTDLKQILLSPGKAYQTCDGVNTVINVPQTRINYGRAGEYLWLELTNSFCHSLARYQFKKMSK